VTSSRTNIRTIAWIGSSHRVTYLPGWVATSGDFAWTAAPANKLTFAIDTFVNPTTVGTDVPGPMADFDTNIRHVWPFIKYQGIYSGPTDSATLGADTLID
jgi:hypothetical protein